MVHLPQTHTQLLDSDITTAEIDSPFHYGGKCFRLRRRDKLESFRLYRLSSLDGLPVRT